MARDLQNLCIETIDEYGIGGGSSGFDVSTTNEQHKRILNWMIAAAMYVDNLVTDFRYLWVDWTAPTLATASSEIPAPVVGTYGEVNQWVRKSLWLDRETSNPLHLRYWDWQTFREMYRDGTIPTADPLYYSVAPDGTIYLDSKTRKTHTPSAEFYRRTEELALDSDEPLMPFNHRRIIQMKTMINYAAREDAPEIMTEVTAEYDDLLIALKKAESPGERVDGFSEAEDQDIITVIE